MKRFDLFSASNLRPFVPPGICTLTRERGTEVTGVTGHNGTLARNGGKSITQEALSSKSYLSYMRTLLPKIIWEERTDDDASVMTRFQSQICMKSDRYKASSPLQFCHIPGDFCDQPSSQYIKQQNEKKTS